MNYSTSTLGHYLRGLRKQKNETLHQVSMGTDIDSPMLSKIERGERLPTIQQLTRLSNYYKIVEEDLKIKYTAEKILKDYGINETTYEAIQLVNEQLNTYGLKPKRRKL